MGVADEHVAFDHAAFGRYQMLAQRMAAGAAIDDHQRARIGADFHAGGVAAVAHRGRSRLGEGAARSPEFNSHARSPE